MDSAASGPAGRHKWASSLVSWQRDFTPKLVSVFAEGYSLADLRRDSLAGLTVAVVALPLAMALAIASGTTPDKGLVTVIVAGLLISLLGGSRTQIGGPTGAFVVIVYGIIADFSYGDLVLATLMAGVILIAAGLLKVATWIKYIPHPVIIGFTAGIGVIIAASQIKDFFGIEGEVPADIIDKVGALWAARATSDVATIALAAASVAVILALRRFAPKLPAFLIVVVLSSIAVSALGLEGVATIGSAFGGIPRSLPLPSLPEGITPERLMRLMPSALTIAFLAGLESLLSAVVADGMTGRRHRSHMEVVAQGAANLASALFGGLPATGAIARTATNIRAGGRTPVAGILHALFVLGFVLVAAPLAAYVPLASLAAVLLMVAWGMSEPHNVVRLLTSGPWGDRAVLAVTFLLTVFADLTIAIEAGVVLAAVLFMHRMAESVEVQTGHALIERPGEGPAEEDFRDSLPEGVEVFQIRGPLFFGVAGRLYDLLDRLPGRPDVFIVRLGAVPLMDTSGAKALADLAERARGLGIKVILSGLAGQPLRVATETGLLKREGLETASDFAAALTAARRIMLERKG